VLYKQENSNISYTFITDPISRDINALINMKQIHVDYLQLELFSINIFDILKLIKDGPSLDYHGKGNNTRGRGRSSPGLSYRSSSNSPFIQMGIMSLINSKISQSEASSSIHLEDIPEDNLLYAQLQAYLTQKQNDIFASIAKEDNDNIKSYEKYLINDLYFPGKSYKTRSYYEIILISIGSVKFQYFLDYNTSENTYNFSKMIIKQIISVEDWGISTVKERQISLNIIAMSFTHWDYIQAFDKVLYYNNDRQKHTWFIKVCANIFAGSIPNWFLNWWPYHGPTIKILPDSYLKLYKEWVKVSPDFNELYNIDHICYSEKID
ncbi:hypothetical protein H5410_060867, partial [Solanum commersonii]